MTWNGSQRSEEVKLTVGARQKYLIWSLNQSSRRKELKLKRFWVFILNKQAVKKRERENLCCLAFYLAFSNQKSCACCKLVLFFKPHKNVQACYLSHVHKHTPGHFLGNIFLVYLPRMKNAWPIALRTLLYFSNTWLLKYIYTSLAWCSNEILELNALLSFYFLRFNLS